MSETSNNDGLNVYLARVARIDRDHRLKLCDWTQLADSPLSVEQKSAWSAYRQALRDVTGQPGFPANVQWPVAPQ
jgi:hypothetical protein